MTTAAAAPHSLPLHTSLSVSQSVSLHVFSSDQQRPALELEWRPSGQAAAAVPGLRREKRGEARLGWGRVGCRRDAQILMRCAVSMATLSEEGKKKRVLSLAAPRSLLCAPSSGSRCPPPQLARPFVRRQMIPQMPRPSRPFQLHSPASPRVRGHHRASEWVSVATVANGGGESGRGLLSLFFLPFFSLFFILFASSWLQSVAAAVGRNKVQKFSGTVPQWIFRVSVLASNLTTIYSHS